MKKGISLFIVLTLLFSMLLAACSSNQTASPAPATDSKPAASKEEKPSAEAEKPKDPVTLKFSIWGNDKHKQMYEELIANFQQVHPHVSVEIMTVPFPDYQQKLSIMLASKTAPDVGWLAERMIPQFLESGQLADVSSNVQSDSAYQYDDIYPSTLQLFTKNDKLYGVPFSTPPTLLFFNKTLFKEKGLKTPLELYAEGKWNYEEFNKAAKAISDPSKGVYGVKLVREWKNWADALFTLIWSQGADVFNKEGTEFTLHTPEGQKALQMYTDMIFKDKVHPKPGDEIAFETGKLGMFRDVYSYVSKAREIKDFEWDIAPMPAGPNGPGTWMGYAGYSVFEGTKHPEEALEFLKFITSQESMGVTSQFFVPSRESVLQSDIFKKAAPQPSPESIQIAVLDQMNEAKVKPGHRNWQQIDVKMQTLLDYLYTQSLSVDEVLQKMEQEIGPLLK
jgi:multiple sugar transport system substrate-binding protein